MQYMCTVYLLLWSDSPLTLGVWWLVSSGAATSFSLKLWTLDSLGAQVSRAVLDFNIVIKLNN